MVLAVLVLLNVGASWRHFRLDLTEEKRYSLSAPTEKILGELDSTVSVEVYLKGDFPAVFRNLQNATRDLLLEMKDASGGRLEYRFVKPGEGLSDSLQAQVFDSLQSMGLKPYNLTVSAKPGDQSSERLIFPAAVIRYGERVEPIDLLSGAKGGDPETRMNNAESLLEFKMADAIHHLTMKTVPQVAYLLGNGEPMKRTSADLILTLLKSYVVDTLTLNRIPIIPGKYAAVVIVKPEVAFTDADKLKIDQYVMYGGKVIWFIDNLHAEMDSLQGTQTQFVAYDKGLNLVDLLFKYGVRINDDLIMDMNSDQVPLAVGSEGGKPQIQMVPWPYFPLLEPSDNSPISRNLEPVLGTFVNSMDTVKAPGIRKTILLTSSDYAHIVSTPAIVTWESVKQAQDPAFYHDKDVTAGVLLEGRFHSLYANRLPSVMRDSLRSYGAPFLEEARDPGKMIVISDGDLVLNHVSQESGIMPMGTNPYTGDQYANKDFFINCMDYLTNATGLIETRNKQLVLRNLDMQKVADERTQWQLIDIALPILLVVIAGAVYHQVRKRQYQK
jgi:gliding-associated putative ABC transporter substrate-binding component GldG